MDMKREITRVAMERFARRGYAGTSMRQIAEAMGLTKAALYHHFPDKEALYREAMAHSSERLCASIAAAAEGIEDPVLRLRRIVHAHLALFIEEADMIRALYHNLLLPDVTIETDRGEKDHPLLDALVACSEAGHIQRERVEDTFLLLVGGVEYSGVRWLLDPSAELPSPALGDRLIAAAVPALGNGPDREAPSSSGRTPSRRASGALTLLCGAIGALSSIAVAAEPAAAPTDAGDTSPEIRVIPGDGETYDVDRCVGAALAANAALEAVRRGAGELSGQKLQALSLGLPSVDVVGSFSRSRDPSFALDETFGGGDAGPDSTSSGFFVFRPEDVPPQSFWRASVDASWEINPTRIWNALGAAQLGSIRQRAIIEDREHRTIESALAAYVGVVRAADELTALDAELAARAEFLDITRRRFLVDFATALDTLQAAVSLANVRPERRRARLALRNAGSELNVVMGRDPLEPLAIVPELELERDRVVPERAVELALGRPDVRQLILAERILAKNRGAQKAEHRPHLSLNGSYGYVARTVEDIGESGKDTWRVSAALTVPIFDGLLTKGRVRETESRIARSYQDRLEAERRARLEALTLAGELEVARENLVAAELNMVRANDALNVSTLRYENGKADYLSVLNARADRFQARSNLIRARYEVLTTTSSLKRAMGVSPVTPLEEALRTQPSSGTRSR